MESDLLLRPPTEIQHIILSDLSKDDLLNLRLTCCRLDTLCVPYMLRKIVDEMNSPAFRGGHLHQAAENCLHDLMLLLLSFRPPLEKIDKSGETAVHIAVRKNCLDCVRKLLTAGADPSTASGQGWTPLMVAARYGHDDVIDELVRAGAEVNAQGFHGWTALHIARRFGHQKAVLLLVEAGADAGVLDYDGIKAGEVCCWTKCWGVVATPLRKE